MSNTVFEKVGKEKNIDPYLLYAISLVESGSKFNEKNTQPHIWAIRSGDYSYYPNTKEEARSILNKLKQTTDNIDVGLMQINYRWHKNRIYKLEDLLEPEVNVRVGADILNECFNRNSDYFFAVGTYHSSEPIKAYKYAVYVKKLYTKLLSGEVR